MVAGRVGHRWLAFSTAFLVVAACSSTVGLTRGADGLLTSGWIRTDLCHASAAIDPVAGTLHGDSSATDPVWLVPPDGTRLIVAWPRGFTVRFEAGARLYDDRGAPVAAEGDRVTLEQTTTIGHRGTPDDPYVARGLVLGGCFATKN